MSQYNHRVEDMPYNGPAATKSAPAIPVRRKPTTPTGVISASAMATALIWMIRSLAVALIVLSLIGTFYGLAGQPAPINNLALIADTIGANVGLLLLAILIQTVLAVSQWGAMHLARADARWYLLYLSSLALSAYWNWQAYGSQMLVSGIPIVVALIIVLAGDILAEKALII